jgi:hypothetical protein
VEYALLIYADESEIAAITPEEIEKHADAFSVFVREAMDRGVLRGGSPLQPTSVATTVRVREGKVMTTDGPFLETKEALAGFFLVDCADLDEAISLASKIPSVHTGSVEVRPVSTLVEEAMAKRTT